MKRRLWMRAFAAFAMIAGSRAYAQTSVDPRSVQPERPTVATHAGTVAPGYLEIEAGVEHDRFAPNDASLSVPVVLKFGVASHAQLSVFSAGMNAGGTSGVGDLSAGLKWRLLDDAPLVGNFAIFPALKFPTASQSKGIGTGTTDASLLLISSHTLGSVSMDLNVGVTRRSGDGLNVPRTATVWTASFGGPFNDRIGWAGEVFGYPGTGGDAGQRPIVGLLAGPTLRLLNTLVVDAGVIAPLSGPQPHAIYAGAVYNVGRIW